MVDVPISETAAAAAAAWSGRKLLGPLMGDIAEGWRQRHEEYRRRNFERILEKAARKAGDALDEEGAVHPRVGAEILDRGSWCDDELMAEYLGGVLAASRSADRRDDRGAVWATLLTQLSAYQIRMHYVVYTSARTLLLDKPVNVRINSELSTRMPLYVPLAEFYESMELQSGPASEEIVAHCLRGLSREDLVGEFWGAWNPEDLRQFRDRDVREGLGIPFGRRVPEQGLVCSITTRGIELYLWGHGAGQRGVGTYLDPSAEFEVEPPVAVCPNACLAADLPTS